MKRFICIILMILYASFAYSEERACLKIGDPAPKFTLKDPDNKEYDLDKIFDKGKANVKFLILVIGNRSTRENGNKWVKELDKLYCKKKDVAIFMIADLRGLPFFVTESMVKWGVKREKLPVPVLLDWGGKVNELYKACCGKSNLFVIDNEGKIRYIFVGQFSQDNLKALDAKIFTEAVNGKYRD